MVPRTSCLEVKTAAWWPRFCGLTSLPGLALGFAQSSSLKLEPPEPCLACRLGGLLLPNHHLRTASRKAISAARCDAPFSMPCHQPFCGVFAVVLFMRSVQLTLHWALGVGRWGVTKKKCEDSSHGCRCSLEGCQSQQNTPSQSTVCGERHWRARFTTSCRHAHCQLQPSKILID